jgi:hypothetical protein
MVVSLAGTTYIEVILHVRAGGKWTLSNSSSAIHNTTPMLAHAVPVDSRGLVSKTVVDINDELVAQVHVDLWAGPLAIDTNDWAFKPIRGGINPSEVPVQVDVLGCGEASPGGQRE